MLSLLWTSVAAFALQALSSHVQAAGNSDPCVAVGGQKWVAPADLRACFRSFPVNQTLKDNTLDVVNLTFNFQTSINYQIQAPPPFAQDVHVDIASELQRIRAQSYPSALDFHIDLSRTIKRLQDGHTAYINICFDSLFLTFLPFPVVLLHDEEDNQRLHIAPEAFKVASAEFADQIDFWQSTSHLNFSQFAGATVLKINDKDPFVAIDANAAITGSFQAHTTRQNKFFSSYALTNSGWSYRMGDFAQQSLPLIDSVTLTVQPVGSERSERITVPYRSRIGAGTIPFTDGPSLQAGNCIAQLGTNGVDANAPSAQAVQPSSLSKGTLGRFRFQPPPAPADSKRRLNVIVNEAPVSDIVLPPGLAPTGNISGTGAIQFFELQDGKTGVLALGSFATGTFDGMEQELLSGLQTLKNNGKTQLIIDLTNNGGGFICVAHWLHRIIVGPNPNSVPEAGLDTKARDQPIARLIVAAIDKGADPNDLLLYNPVNWRNASGVEFPPESDWLVPSVNLTLNGHPDMFSQRLGQECQPFDMTPPAEQLFAPENIVIVNNGLCASSCALATIALSKHYNVTTAVVGGKKDTVQQYTGTVGGQSSDFSTMDTEVKTTHLKNNSLAPPDFLTNSVFGITWRLGFGIVDPTQPEEWQGHFATLNFPQTASTVNNPIAIWNAVVARVFS